MNKYAEMKDRQQKEFNQFPLKFAFDDKGFERGMEELGLKPEDTDKIYSTCGGGFYRKEDAPALEAMMDSFDRELKAAIDADETGEGFVYQMFLYELDMHEFAYTEDPEDALYELGYKLEDVMTDPKLRRGFEKAVNRIWAREECA